MPFKAKHLRIDHNSKISIKLGYKVTTVTLEVPTKQLAAQIVSAAFGKDAKIVGKR